MRVLIDTNVLISAALSANGVPFQAYVKAAWLTMKYPLPLPIGTSSIRARLSAPANAVAHPSACPLADYDSIG